MALDEPDFLQSRLDELVAKVLVETRVPGIAVGVSVHGRRFRACGGARDVDESVPLTVNATYQLGCAAKLAQAIVSLDLARRGSLDLDASIGEYLPTIRRTSHGGNVRVSDLLSHTSGYRGTNVLDPEMRALTPDGLAAFMRRTPRLFAPGSVFSYEHTESVLLEQVLRRVTGSASFTAAAALPPTNALPEFADAGRHRFD